MFLLELFLLLSVIESKQPIKLCSECKFFVPGPSIQQGKCKLFLNLCDNHPLEPLENTLWIVPTEYNESTAHFNYCFVARTSKNMCGRNGKCFSKIRGSS